QKAAYNKYLEDQIRLQLHDYDRRAEAGASTPLPKDSTIGSLTDKNGNLCSKNGQWTACFILRDSFQDISVFSAPKDVKSANGATFSWADDAVAANTTWSARGVAAYPISWATDQNLEPRSASCWSRIHAVRDV